MGVVAVCRTTAEDRNGQERACVRFSPLPNTDWNAAAEWRAACARQSLDSEGWARWRMMRRTMPTAEERRQRRQSLGGRTSTCSAYRLGSSHTIQRRAGDGALAAPQLG